MKATWLAEVLRSAGLVVVEHEGWRTRSNGEFDDIRAVTWHHDGSPVGDSPGVPGVLIRNWATASANCWVDLRGRWHLIGAGVSYHAGRVLPGKPGNWDSIGVETDHTTGETWSGVPLLDSLRRGTAAILRHIEEPVSTGLEFHSSVCSPVGRKTDPDALDLDQERAAVHPLLYPAHPPEDDMTILRTTVDATPEGTKAVLFNYDVPYEKVIGLLPGGPSKVWAATGIDGKGYTYVYAEPACKVEVSFF